MPNTNGKTYVLQSSETAPYDDISVLDEPMIAEVDSARAGYAERARMAFPCVLDSADKSTVRPWCQTHGITLTPHEFIKGQVDYIVELDTPKKRKAFERKWLASRR
jgi:hypothetical protein